MLFNSHSTRDIYHLKFIFKGAVVMQAEKALTNDQLRVSKLFLKFRISATYNFPVIYPGNLLFS